MSTDDLTVMRRMDELYLTHPFYGSRRMVAVLRREGWAVNRKRARRLMRLMDDVPQCAFRVEIRRCRQNSASDINVTSRWSWSAAYWKSSDRTVQQVPARVVVVHDEPSFRDPLVISLRAAGHVVVAFADPVLAWDALRFSGVIEILVTRVQFEAGKPHGVALARWARETCPAVRILVVALPEFQTDIEGLGVLLPRPVSVPQVAEAVGLMLSNERLGRGHEPDDSPS